MTISYNWLHDYLPQRLAPEKLATILTAIGLEVEAMAPFDAVPGNLAGLLIGEVLEAAPHPNADKLTLTQVTLGAGPLQIVCGAPNVAAGQKVVVAPVGATLFSTSGESMTMKKAKIRGEESNGMICAEDEIGLGTSHAGILVLPPDALVGMPAADYFKPYQDTIYEIGLTPNRSDAMSHWGVARDVCAYLSHHQGKAVKAVIPQTHIAAGNHHLPVKVTIENTDACKRYTAVAMEGLKVKPSPDWLQLRLKAIGQRPVNNVVDITNFILHETGQPLHAFDYDAIPGGEVIVKNSPEGSPFISLDGKTRTLAAADLMICNRTEGMCIAGVFGGAESGISAGTTRLFLESAYFAPVTIRKTSFRHGLRTDAAARFEKGIDISATRAVLERAAFLIKEVAGGGVASDVIDVYPAPQQKPQVALPYGFLKKLSGKAYSPEVSMGILKSLGFEIVHEDAAGVTVAVPYHKPDITGPADLVEEILRIDGLDAIPIPTRITISPAVEKSYADEALNDKVAGFLTGLGFSEILTNSITASAYITAGEKETAVRLLNNLSTELDVLRPAMVYTALEVMAFNQARRITDLKLFEWGKTYFTNAPEQYGEQRHFCLYISGAQRTAGWNDKGAPADAFYARGVLEATLLLAGISNVVYGEAHSEHLAPAKTALVDGNVLATLGQVRPQLAAQFAVKGPVFMADVDWDAVLRLAAARKPQYREIPKFPAVERDLALVVPSQTPYSVLESELQKLRLPKLQQVRLFDVFESEKLGAGKKSIAINFLFQDSEKTLTDKEVDGWMQKIMTALEKNAGAEIRR